MLILFNKINLSFILKRHFVSLILQLNYLIRRMLLRTIDNADNQEAVQHWLKTGLEMGWVKAVEEAPLWCPAVDERMKEVLLRLEKEKLIKYGYDYAWILQLANNDNGKTMPLFNRVSSFRRYLLMLGIKKVCHISTLNEYYNKVSGDYPKWTFTDEPNPCDGYERLWRINIAHSFLDLYRQYLDMAT